MVRSSLAAVLSGLAVAALACAAPVPAPDRGTAWGYVRLVPHAGVTQGAFGAGGGAYADRRYADAELVDYSRPGFVVVYLEGAAGPAAVRELEIREGLGGLRVEPPHAALGFGGAAWVTNGTGSPQVVSCPDLGLLVALAPGERTHIEPRRPGETTIFVPGTDEARATLFSAPGPFAVVDGDGRFELHGVAPGRHRIHAWHPRLPPTQRAIELPAGVATRIDLELGVGLGDASDSASGGAR